ncbi:hypothetical protein FIV00_15260 [Labrenzia sp. THAF82]|uniref:hypothetical protein n=1 Tax=Labrenzia sp. THAF82 TaxID=2587861 RepID=UPI0012683FF3|nr:hypothetical protein [Labrenzia sp. THAF82]QFT31850.1 hypothetical protein FIV00_15260 [Labrenzia sp. THAF82]
MTVTVQGPESPADKRYEYDHAVIELALTKTRAKYGDFKIQYTPVGQNSKRALIDASNNKYANFIIKFSMNNDLPDSLTAIPFPVDLGVVGYRVAFVSEKTKSALSKVRTLEDLKEFEVLQGLGWLDTRILEHHGFQVRTGAEYEAMFSMVALGRSDLFLRGANELLNEWQSHLEIDGLAYDEAVSIYYPLPRFLVTSSENEELIARIQEGLHLAHEDGSLLKLWDQKYRASVDFAKLDKRRIFRLSNPFIEGLDPSWQKFVYQVGPDLTQ